MNDAFFTLHSKLEREGPGEPADVEWAAGIVGLKPNARICDAACGPGADIPALLAAAPDGHVTAVDSHKPFIDEVFIDEVFMRVGNDPRVTAYAGDMLKLKGPFDLIWCAGAVYFAGIRKALSAWRPCLSPGGTVAFSEPCFFTDKPTDGARAFWDGYPTQDETAIRAAVAAADYEVLATRRISDAAWEAYYGPMAARIASLREGAGEALAAALDEGENEIEGYRRHKAETGYLLSVVRPV